MKQHRERSCEGGDRLANHRLSPQHITPASLRANGLGQSDRRKVVRLRGWIYPETPEAYHAIRKYVETEKLEAFTYQLPEDRNQGCYSGHAGRYPRRNNTRSPDGDFSTRPNSARGIRNASSAVSPTSPGTALLKTSATEATCCNCQGNHPANFTGCPRNPLNKPPPTPKVNFWERTSPEKEKGTTRGSESPSRRSRAATTSAPAYTPHHAAPAPQTETNTHSFPQAKPPLKLPTPPPAPPTHLLHRRNTQAAASTAGNLGPDLLKIFRNRPQCIIVGDFNAKHTSWSATPHNNSAGNTIVSVFVRANGFLLTALTDPQSSYPRQALHHRLWNHLWDQQYHGRSPLGPVK
ncbi:hypothetical protein TNCV_3025581 [Trichonephila clavipes]|nr:hypothetical protein TNCV_3025581 [Trichonephila clavipes]